SVRRNPGKPQWDGSSPIAGKTILLHAEQGFGDTIQFARYVPLVEQLGARIILDVQPPVRQIVAPLVSQGITLLPGERPPAFDCYCPLASLPLAFKTELSTIPDNVPYLAAPPDRLAAWSARLPAGRKVGLVWSGNPNFRNDGWRSMQLPQVMPLLRVA